MSHPPVVWLQPLSVGVFILTVIKNYFNRALRKIFQLIPLYKSGLYISFKKTICLAEVQTASYI